MSVKKIIFLLVLTLAFSITSVAALYLWSENIMKSDNPFIRRLPPSSATKTAEYILENPYYYFAGEAKGKLYLANHKAPLHIIEIDTSLSQKKLCTIELNRYDFPFRSVEVRIHPPYFYLFDGMVPVIYRGLISDFKAEVFLKENHFFTDAAIINPGRIAIRGQKIPSGEYVLGTIEAGEQIETKYHPGILEKQIDGIFDADGIMNYSEGLRKFIYTYSYRNEFIVTDERLALEFRGKTIDTTTKAKLKIVKINSSGDTKLAAPPYLVNKNSAVFGNLLFINSALRGRYEIDEIWDQASTIDVYDIEKNEYISSFYIYNDIKAPKAKEFLVNADAIYAIIGNSLHKYTFGKPIKTKFHIPSK